MKSADCTLKPDELPVEDKYYKPDLEISDRFQAYSAELLRVSLAGVAAIGFFFDKLSQFLNFPQQFWGNFTVKGILILSLISLATSSALALLHRYLSSDSMAYHLTFIRLARAAESENDENRKKCLKARARTEKKWRDRFFSACEILLGASAFALGIGAFCLVIGFAYGLK
jgi:uncharacterized membrane protein YfcA